MCVVYRVECGRTSLVCRQFDEILETPNGGGEKYSRPTRERMCFPRTYFLLFVAGWDTAVCTVCFLVRCLFFSVSGGVTRFRGLHRSYVCMKEQHGLVKDIDFRGIGLAGTIEKHPFRQE